MADNHQSSNPPGGAGHADSDAADEYSAFAVDGEFYAIGFPDGEEAAEDVPVSSSPAAPSSPLASPHLQNSDHYHQPPSLGMLSPSPPDGVGWGSGSGGEGRGGDNALYARSPSNFDHTGTAFHNLNSSSPLFSPGPPFAGPPAAVGGPPSSDGFSATSSSDEAFPDTLYTPGFALAPLHPTSPQPQPFPHERSPLHSPGAGDPSPSPPPQTGRTLVETVLTPPGSARPSSMQTSLTPAPTAGKRAGYSLRKIGTVKRTMSMRGGKPRVMKVRVVSKTDSKSYFSVERTMYQWIYMSAVILGNALTFYGIVHPDLKIVHVAQLSATLLSFLALAVAYYAAIYAFRRRQALNRQAEAAAFDDRFGPIGIVVVIVVTFIAAEALTLRSAIRASDGKPFTLS